MVKKDYKELDEAIKAKIQPYLYNEGKGAMVPIAQLACLRNRDRSKSKMVSAALFECNCTLAAVHNMLYFFRSSLKSGHLAKMASILYLKVAICWPK